MPNYDFTHKQKVQFRDNVLEAGLYHPSQFVNNFYPGAFAVSSSAGSHIYINKGTRAQRQLLFVPKEHEPLYNVGHPAVSHTTDGVYTYGKIRLPALDPVKYRVLDYFDKSEYFQYELPVISDDLMLDLRVTRGTRFYTFSKCKLSEETEMFSPDPSISLGYSECTPWVGIHSLGTKFSFGFNATIDSFSITDENEGQEEFYTVDINLKTSWAEYLPHDEDFSMTLGELTETIPERFIQTSIVSSSWLTFYHLPTEESEQVPDDYFGEAHIETVYKNEPDAPILISE